MAEDAVFANELMASTILTANSEAVVASNLEWVIRFWNPGAERPMQSLQLVGQEQ